MNWKTTGISCNVSIADVGPLTYVQAAVLDGQLYYCGIRIRESTRRIRLRCFKNQNGVWIPAPSMGFHMHDNTLNTVGSYIFAAGGYGKQAQIFDGVTWVKLPYKLSTFLVNHCTVAVSDTEVVIIGGSFTGEKLFVEKYNIFKGLVQKIPSSSVERLAHACARIGSDIYISGGIDNYNDLRTVEVLNLDTLQWRTIPSMNFPRFGHTMEAVNGKLTVFGGRNFNNKFNSKNTSETFDGNVWKMETLNGKYSGHASAVVPCK